MKLTFPEQDIIELVIQEPRTADGIADALGRGYWDTISVIRGLAEKGLIATRSGDADGDVVCPNCDEDEQSGEPGDACVSCEARLEDDCRWVYVGGSVSEFFNYALTKGEQDGIQNIA